MYKRLGESEVLWLLTRGYVQANNCAIAVKGHKRLGGGYFGYLQGGTFKRITVPSLLGVMPRSLA